MCLFETVRSKYSIIESLSIDSSPAFKLKMRNEVMPNASVTDPQLFTEKITLAKEIADVLRRNVVQARKAEDREAWGALTPSFFKMTYS